MTDKETPMHLFPPMDDPCDVAGWRGEETT